MKLTRDQFFAAMRNWSRLNQPQVDGLNSLLDSFEADDEMTDVRWIAYALATVKHETAGTYKPIAEYGKGKGKPYGKPDKETGQTYYGRGYCQLTHKDNYETMGDLLEVDLLNEPDLALEPEIAYRIMSIGMREGLFTGKRLSHYIHGDTCDYVNARRIINGVDKAALIAGYARRFETILDLAQAEEPATEVAPETVPKEASTEKVITTTTTATESPDVTIEKKSIVETVTGSEKAKEIAGTGLSAIGNRLATGGISGGAMAAIGAFVEKAWPLLIFAAVLIILGVAVWMLIYHNHHKEKQIEAQIAADPNRRDIVFTKKKKAQVAADSTSGAKG